MLILTVGALKDHCTDQEIADYMEVPVSRVAAIRAAWDRLAALGRSKVDLVRAVTDKMVAEFTGITRRMAQRIRARLNIRKRRDYHTWKGTDFRVINKTRWMGYDAKAAAPLIGVSDGALYKAWWRFTHPHPQLAV